MQHAENTTVVVKVAAHEESFPCRLQPFCDVISLGDRNPPNLETAKCLSWQIRQILYPPIFPAIWYNDWWTQFNVAMVTSPPRSGSTSPACTGTCHVTKCRACYYSRRVQPCPTECPYSCGEDPETRCFNQWGRCVKDNLTNVSALPPLFLPLSTLLTPHCISISLFLSQVITRHRQQKANRFKCMDPCEC